MKESQRKKGLEDKQIERFKANDEGANKENMGHKPHCPPLPPPLAALARRSRRALLLLISLSCWWVLLGGVVLVLLVGDAVLGNGTIFLLVGVCSVLSEPAREG